MGVAENKQIVRSFYEAGNRGDMDVCLDLISDDITWTNIGSTRLSGTYRGKAELMEKLLGPLFGQLKGGISSSIDNLFGESDYVIAMTSGTAETTDGRPYNNKYCQVIRIRDSKFVEVTEYFDTELTSSIFGSASSVARRSAVLAETTEANMNRELSVDPVTLDPDKFEVRLENEQIRVLEARVASGEGHGMHWHPKHLIYTLSSYKVRDTFPDGSTKIIEREAGEFLWGEELTHATQNVGKTGVHALIIEFRS